MNGTQNTVVKGEEVKETKEGVSEVVNRVGVKYSDIKNRAPLPKNISGFKKSDSNTDRENDIALALVQQQGRMAEPEDDWMEYFQGLRKTKPKIPLILKDDSTSDMLPEYSNLRIYPNKIKPNISIMKQWVNERIVSQMSDDEVMEKYYERRETSGFVQMMNVDKNFMSLALKSRNKRRNPSTTRKLLVDSLAYMVSRKIWYVGRKPSDMNDHDWSEQTKFSRPSEGSYGGGDTWTDFKYDVNYKYQSGVY